jgi:hypothetical protein
MNLRDLTDDQYADLGERALNDYDIVRNFVKENPELFQEYLWNFNLDPDTCTENLEWNFAEKHDEQFIQFAFDVYRKQGKL